MQKALMAILFTRQNLFANLILYFRTTSFPGQQSKAQSPQMTLTLTGLEVADSWPIKTELAFLLEESRRVFKMRPDVGRCRNAD